MMELRCRECGSKDVRYADGDTDYCRCRNCGHFDRVGRFEAHDAAGQVGQAAQVPTNVGTEAETEYDWRSLDDLTPGAQVFTQGITLTPDGTIGTFIGWSGYGRYEGSQGYARVDLGARNGASNIQWIHLSGLRRVGLSPIEDLRAQLQTANIQIIELQALINQLQEANEKQRSEIVSQAETIRSLETITDAYGIRDETRARLATSQAREAQLEAALRTSLDKLQIIGDEVEPGAAFDAVLEIFAIARKALK